MNKNWLTGFWLLGLSLTLIGCGVSEKEAGDLVSTSVQVTVNAVPTASPYATLTPRPTYTPYPTRTSIPTPTLSPGSTQISRIDGMVLSYIPAGTFQMGQNAARGIKECRTLYEPYSDEYCTPNWFTDAEPVHSVTLAAFWMDQTEVTYGMYAQCVAAGACNPPADTGEYDAINYYGDIAYANFPVNWVDWNQATAYCAWAGRRLPTEAEWEYAARGGLAAQTYPWGEAFNGQMANFCDFNCEASWYNLEYNDGFTYFAPVGSYSPNGYGLFDLAGNLAEWVADWYEEDYYSSSPTENPSGPASGEGRVIRGGAWIASGDILQVSYRGWDYPGTGNDDIGFRCVLSP